MKIIGVIARIAGGKGEVVNYLTQEHGFMSVSFGDMVREEVRAQGLSLGRDNEDMVSKQKTKDNPNYWREKVSEKVKELINSGVKVVIDGIRYPEDVAYFRNVFGDDFFLVFVDRSTEKRFEGIKKRGRPGDPQTLEEFRKQDERQNELFRLNESIKQADYVLDNNGTIEELHANVDKMLRVIPEL